MSTEWKRVGAIDGPPLIEARSQLHWAAQFVAAVGQTFVTPRPDDSHPSLQWVSAIEMLVGNATNTEPSFHAALEPATLTVWLLDAAMTPLSGISLDGLTRADVFERLDGLLATYAGVSSPLVRDPYEIPTHAVGDGGTFCSQPAAAYHELARWFANADGALRQSVAHLPQASPIRCWPHHFDMAVLLSFDTGEDAEKARSIGVGMTPGDASYALPYWYVNPWPPPPQETVPEHAGPGRWHLDGWVGVVLEYSDVIGVHSPEGQADLVQDYIRESIITNKALLDVPD